MKQYIGQTAAPVSNTTFDFTDPVVASDWKGHIFFGSEATANDTTTATGQFIFGATDGVRNVCVITALRDAQTGAAARAVSYASNTACVARMIVSSSSVNLLGAYSATLANGVRLALSANDATAHLINGLGFAGADIEFAVSSVAFASTDTVKTVTHNLTGTPDIVIMASINGLVSFGTTGEARMTIGIYDGTNSVGVGFNQTTQVTPTTLAAMLTTDFGHSIVSLADHATFSLANVGASTFDCRRSVAAGDAACVIFVAIRAPGGGAIKKAFTANLPTATGSAALVSGLGANPSVMMMIPTRLIANTLQTDDSTGSLGISAAVNNGGATQQAAMAIVTQDAAATSVGKCRITTSAALLALNTTPAVNNQATVTSWTGGVTLNHTTVGLTANKVIGFVFGIAAAGSNVSLSVDSGAAAISGQQADSDIAAPWTEGALTISGQDIALNASGLSYTVTVDAGSVALNGQAMILDQAPGFTSGTVTLGGQSLTLVTSSIAPPLGPLSVWAGDLVLQKNWHYLAGLGYCAALRMKTSSAGIQLQLSAIDYIYKPGGLI